MLRLIRSQTTELNLGDCVFVICRVGRPLSAAKRSVDYPAGLRTFHAGVGWMRLIAASRSRRRPTHAGTSLLSGGGATVRSVAEC